jgi:hypothetical protein
LIAGVQPAIFYHKGLNSRNSSVMKSYWGQPGVPGPGSYDSTLNGAVINGPVAGALPFANPGGSDKTYLFRWHGIVPSNATEVWLCDRLWNNQFDATVTTLQNITSPTWPARDLYGSTDGVGVYFAVENSTAMGAAAPVITVTYTDSGGTGGLTTTITTVTSSLQWNFSRPISFLHAGVRSIQGVQLSASWLSGTAHLVAHTYKALFMGTAFNSNTFPATWLRGGLPRIYDDSALFFVDNVASTSTTWYTEGLIHLVQG